MCLIWHLPIGVRSTLGTGSITCAMVTNPVVSTMTVVLSLMVVVCDTNVPGGLLCIDAMAERQQLGEIVFVFQNATDPRAVISRSPCAQEHAG